MRKYRVNQIIIFLVTVLLTSCEKLIQIDLSTSSPKYVIQGNIFDQAGPYKVIISKTVNFDSLSIYPAVTNAVVTISDNAGNTEKLLQTTDGTYVTTTLQGTPGRTYNLTVDIDGTIYTSSSTMRAAINIDKIYYKNAPIGKSKLVVIDFINPSGNEFYYRVIHFVNGNQSAGFNVFSEMTLQNDSISYSFMRTNATPTLSTPALVKGDIITVWLECIDKGVFEYFRTANSEGGQNASPANPVSNISNGALGYFSASSVRKALIVYP